MQVRTLLTALAGGVVLAGCASTAANPEDPYEPFNRQMYAFNDNLDRAVIAPVAKGYRAVTNEPVRTGVSNFVKNLGEPVTFANEVLQGRFGAAAGTAGRFLLNSTVGIVGLLNPAEDVGLGRVDEDFGQTLGVWGVPSGPYLVLPFLGSTSPRDFFGIGVDMALNPLNHAEFEGDDATRIGLAATGGLVARESLIDTIDDARSTQLDPYVTLRRFHVRNRQALIGNVAPGPTDVPKVPDYELDF